jgi:tetratricopeptide (TPR) repeat protein
MSGEGGKLSKEELREDEFVEWVMGAVAYVRARYRIFLGGVLLIAVGVLGVNLIIDKQDRARNQAAADLGEALVLDDGGDTAEAMRVIQQVVDQYDGTPAAGQGVLMLANRRFAQEDYEIARQLYQRYLSEYGERLVLVYAAQSGIAAVMEAQGKVQEAAEEYRRVAQLHEGLLQGALALWEASECYGQLGDVVQRRELLQRIAREHARLPLAARARAALAML